MNHLIVSREYPPCNYPQGGIGTYVAHMARVLAEAGETVHVIGEQWAGAPLDREEFVGGRLIVHRVALDTPLDVIAETERASERELLAAMLRSEFTAQAFSWQVARLAEALIEDGHVDCIEAQEFEGPLYHLMLRRALGLGPERKPPCIVHLHTPMQFVCLHNDWSIALPRHMTMKRHEDYVIAAADAVLSPSHYLARQAEHHYGLEPGSVQRIPYPMGEVPRIERQRDTWEGGSICYFGRMEGRKGVFEWLEAVIAVAAERPDLRFELIGSDTSLTCVGPTMVREVLESRIPDRLRDSIRILDAMPRDKLIRHLAGARMAVVPSRWENFPNTCIEAMATGLPVLVTSEGGMVEMIEDGRTGWIAGRVSPAELAAVLRRALATPPAVLEQMGVAAATEIRRICDERTVLDAQMAFRREVAARGAVRSTVLPRRGSSLIPNVPPLPIPARASSERTARPSGDPATYVEAGHRDAFTAALNAGDPDAAIIVVEPGFAPRAGVLDAMARAIATDGAIGAAIGWYVDADGAPHFPPPPGRPWQWVVDDPGPCIAFRRRALASVEWMENTAGAPGAAELLLAVLLEGWIGTTVPVWLGHRRVRAARLFDERLAIRSQLLPRLAQRYPAEHAADAAQLLTLASAPRAVVLIGGAAPAEGQGVRAPLRARLRPYERMLDRPWASLRWLLRRMARPGRDSG